MQLYRILINGLIRDEIKSSSSIKDIKDFYSLQYDVHPTAITVKIIQEKEQENLFNIEYY